MGDRLGPYEVVSPLGAGGMGEVYRAHDTKLDRDVALKVLPQGSLADEAARKRFRKEALALSRLSHPHIASLFDFDTSEGGTDFLVMELVSGPSLDTKLRRGPLPEKEVVRLGAQVLRGLVAAHERGIVHRDLKPQNIRLTPDGIVKVLDFGLARVAPAMGDNETTDTASGSIAGTPPYMSPEQLLGKEVDARTDVYAAGVVLYEMATGRRPFGEASGPQLVAKILNERMPPPRELNPALSPPLEQVILKAADKDKELRYQTAKELLVDLERLAAGTAAGLASGSSAAPGIAGSRPGALRSPLRIGVAAVALIAVGGAVSTWLLRPREPRITATRVLVRIEPAGLETDGVNAYYSTGDRLMAVPLAGGQPRSLPLPWKDGLGLVSIRRDPPTLLLKRRTELWRVPLTGDAPTRIDGLPPVAGAAWSRQGDRLAWIEDRDEAQVLWVGDAAGKGQRQLVEVPKGGGSGPALFLVGWHPSGQWLRYIRSDGPRVIDVNVAGVSRRDVPYVPLPDEWSVSTAWTPDGEFFVLGSQRGVVAVPERDLPWFAATARAPIHLGGPTHAFHIRFTPEGQRLVAFVFRVSAELLRLDAVTGVAGPPVMDGTRAYTLAYSPDGSRVAWVAAERWPGRLWISRPDGSERLPLGDLDVDPYATLTWSPDGHFIAFTSHRQRELVDAPFRLHLASPTEGTVEPLTSEEPGAAQGDACWSPDGRWLAYGGRGSGEQAPPYLRRVDLATRRVTRLEGSEGLWSPRCAADGRMLAMDLSAQIAESRSQKTGRRRAHFKLRDPATGRWTPLAVLLPPGCGADSAAPIAYPTWSRDGRHVIANACSWLVRFDAGSGHLEVVTDLTGLGGAGMKALDPEDNALVMRDMTDREIVVMDLAR